MTSVSSSTIISSTSSLFTLIFAFLFQAESFTIIKLLAVLSSVTGVVIVTWADEKDQGTESLFGDGLALLSALSYGIYAVMLPKKIPQDSPISLPMFFGFVGLINGIFLLPILMLFNFSKIEIFQLPETKMVWFYIFLNGIIGSVISDYLWAKSILLLNSPLIATLGLSLTVPLAMASDALLHHKKFSWNYLWGSVLVFGGFVIVNFDDQLMNFFRSFLSFLSLKYLRVFNYFKIKSDLLRYGSQPTTLENSK